MKKIVFLDGTECTKKLAKLKANRAVKPSTLAKMQKSLQEYGQLMPAVVVEDVGELEVVTLDNQPVTNKEDYYVIVDGVHRTTAWMSLDKDEPFYIMKAINTKMAIQKMLVEINCATTTYDGADYLNALYNCSEEELPLVSALQELCGVGFNISCATQWLTFSKSITKQTLVAAVGGKIADALKNTSGIERGKKLLEAAEEKFSADFLHSKYLITFIIDKYNNTPDEKKGAFTEKMLGFLNGLSIAKASEVEKVKGIRGAESKDTAIYKKLETLYKGLGVKMFEGVL